MSLPRLAGAPDGLNTKNEPCGRNKLYSIAAQGSTLTLAWGHWSVRKYITLPRLLLKSCGSTQDPIMCRCKSSYVLVSKVFSPIRAPPTAEQPSLHISVESPSVQKEI